MCAPPSRKGSRERSRDDDYDLGPVADLHDLLEELAPALPPSQEGFRDLADKTRQLAEVEKKPQGKAAEYAEIDHAMV